MSAGALLHAVFEELKEKCPILPPLCNLVYQYLLPPVISQQELAWLKSYLNREYDTDPNGRSLEF